MQYKLRFQRTYEELKLVVLLTQQGRILRFQRTYEELKRQWVKLLRDDQRVFSVPMRN